MAAMASFACVQPSWASSSTIVNGVGVATRATMITTSAQTAVLCRAPAHSCSEFLGSGVYASSSSVVFNRKRSLVDRQAVVSQRRRVRGQNLVVRGLFGLGVPELAVIAGVAAILFGPKKLPEIGKSLGKTVKSFQQAAKEFESEVKSRAGAAVEPTTTESDKTENQVTPTSVSAPTSKSTSSDKESA